MLALPSWFIVDSIIHVSRWLFGRADRFYRNRMVWFDLGMIKFALSIDWSCFTWLCGWIIVVARALPSIIVFPCFLALQKESIVIWEYCFWHHLNLILLLKVCAEGDSIFCDWVSSLSAWWFACCLSACRAWIFPLPRRICCDGLLVIPWLRCGIKAR